MKTIGASLGKYPCDILGMRMGSTRWRTPEFAEESFHIVSIELRK